MMQAAEPWHGKDLGACRRTFRSFSESRSLFIQTKMCSVVVIIADVLIHQALQMPLIQNDHMVEQIAAAGNEEAKRRLAQHAGS